LNIVKEVAFVNPACALGGDKAGIDEKSFFIGAWRTKKGCL